MFGWLVVIWIISRWIGGALRVPIVAPLARVIGWMTLLLMLFGALTLVDWLTPIYTLLPNNGLMAVAFIPLTFATFFYVWHVALWSSWRYAVVRDTKSHDATLIIVGGIFNFSKREFQLERISETRIHQDWWERILNVGDVEFVEVGGSGSDHIRHVSGPNQLEKVVKDCNRDRRRRAVGVTD